MKLEEEQATKKRQKIEQDATIQVKSIRVSRISLHEPKMKPKVTPKPRLSEAIENQNTSLQDLIAKAKNKVQEKRQIDQREAEIKSLRLAARLAITQMAATVVFENHLSYHTELEELGCSFIHDQVTLLSRSDYKRRRSTKDKSMLEYCSQDSQITKNHVVFGSVESTNQKTNQV